MTFHFSSLRRLAKLAGESARKPCAAESANVQIRFLWPKLLQKLLSYKRPLVRLLPLVSRFSRSLSVSVSPSVSLSPRRNRLGVCCGAGGVAYPLAFLLFSSFLPAAPVGSYSWDFGMTDVSSPYCGVSSFWSLASYTGKCYRTISIVNASGVVGPMPAGYTLVFRGYASTGWGGAGATLGDWSSYGFPPDGNSYRAIFEAPDLPGKQLVGIAELHFGIRRNSDGVIVDSTKVRYQGVSTVWQTPPNPPSPIYSESCTIGMTLYVDPEAPGLPEVRNGATDDLPPMVKPFGLALTSPTGAPMLDLEGQQITIGPGQTLVWQGDLPVVQDIVQAENIPVDSNNGFQIIPDLQGQKVSTVEGVSMQVVPALVLPNGMTYAKDVQSAVVLDVDGAPVTKTQTVVTVKSADGATASSMVVPNISNNYDNSVNHNEVITNTTNLGGQTNVTAGSAKDIANEIGLDGEARAVEGATSGAASGKAAMKEGEALGKSYSQSVKASWESLKTSINGASLTFPSVGSASASFTFQFPALLGGPHTYDFSPFAGPFRSFWLVVISVFFLFRVFNLLNQGW